MKGSLGSTARWILATLLIVASLQRSDAIRWGRRPNNPTILVEGVNNTAQSLEWEIIDEGDIIVTVRFHRTQSVAGGKTEELASRLGSDNAFNVFPQFRQKYNTSIPSTLQLLNERNNEEFVYSIEVSYRRGGSLGPAFTDKVAVIVYVPPTITKEPERKSEVNVGQNLTLTCEASGDPTPNVTWTKDGVPQNMFNVSNVSVAELHLVNVQRENIGSYICTADNIVGIATGIAIVTVACPAKQCIKYEVGINLTSVVWTQAFLNPNAIEYKTLTSNLSAAIANIYTKPENVDKQLYIVNIVEYRSGSTIAIVHLYFQRDVLDPLKPLRDVVAEGNLAQFTVAKKFVPTAPSNITTTRAPPGPTGTTTSREGLTSAQIGGIVGGSVAFVVVLIVIGVAYFFYSQKKKKEKPGKSYSEKDGYRMNKQPPSSGLGTASPAYVEARMYAPPDAARRQDGAEKRPLPVGTGGSGQDGQGGFELWC